MSSSSVTSLKPTPNRPFQAPIILSMRHLQTVCQTVQAVPYGRTPWSPLCGLNTACACGASAVVRENRSRFGSTLQSLVKFYLNQSNTGLAHSAGTLSYFSAVRAQNPSSSLPSASSPAMDRGRPKNDPKPTPNSLPNRPTGPDGRTPWSPLCGLNTACALRRTQPW